MNICLDDLGKFPKSEYDFLDNYRHLGAQWEGWLMVCEGDPPADMSLAPSPNHNAYPPWHPAFCVLRPDEMSLIGYRREFYGLAPPNLVRIRMDGGRSGFASYWKIPYSHVYSQNLHPRERYSIAAGPHTISRCNRLNRGLPEATLRTDSMPYEHRFSTMPIDYGNSNSNNYGTLIFTHF
ncbi:hypothetical protein WR25_00767 [Diploscapter pachys]|uniref:Uncharacterized protein n=1 Tax=Diploscapter pachys TaxID=2018661 RepID=A0A2A2LF35_9BILA|nr:hypothetical protein WR25_00767 [Diploscapter pachys]